MIPSTGTGVQPAGCLHFGTKQLVWLSDVQVVVRILFSTLVCAPLALFAGRPLPLCCSAAAAAAAMALLLQFPLGC